MKRTIINCDHCRKDVSNCNDTKIELLRHTAGREGGTHLLTHDFCSIECLYEWLKIKCYYLTERIITVAPGGNIKE
jgi:hypothetical protein